MTEQIIADCNRAYAAGSAIATDPKTDPINDCPLWVSTRELRNAFADGFREMRDQMFTEFCKNNKLTLLPHNSSKGDGVFRKAADCVG